MERPTPSTSGSQQPSKPRKKSLSDREILLELEREEDSEYVYDPDSDLEDQEDSDAEYLIENEYSDDDARVTEDIRPVSQQSESDFSTVSDIDDSDITVPADENIRTRQTVAGNRKKRRISHDVRVRRSVRRRRPGRGQRSRGRVSSRSSDDGWEDIDVLDPIGYVFDDSSAGISSDCPLTPDAEKKYEYFTTIFHEDIVKEIINETETYYQQVNRECTVLPKSRTKRWKTPTVSEFYAFIALTCLMAHVKKHRVRDYWSNDPRIRTAFFRKYMSRDRYNLIMRFLHFTDNDKVEERKDDKLWKIRDIFEKVRSQLSLYFSPNQKLVIDESLLLFKGRLSIKQYIKSKRHRFGVKLYVLCDCKTGMILDIIVYTGTAVDIPSNDPLGHSGSVVKVLMSKYLDQGHILYTDNFYTSPGLSAFLHERNTGTVGTVRVHRKGMPSFIGRLERGNIQRKSKGELLALRWRDKRDIQMLSTVHKGQMVESRKVDPITKEPKIKPDAVIDYTHNMRLVDKSDMLIGTVECVRRSLKWYKKVFFHLIDVMMMNAYVLYKLKSGKSLSLREFSLDVISQLLTKYGTIQPSRPIGRPPSQVGEERLQQAAYISRHYLAAVPGTKGRATGQWICHVCNHTERRERKIKKKVSTYCKECEIGLCLDCFREYHTMARF